MQVHVELANRAYNSHGVRFFLQDTCSSTRRYSQFFMTFKGVLPMEIQLMLDHFIHVQCLFTLDMLNDRIASFCYGRSEKKNKPPRQLENKHIKGSTKFPMSGTCEMLLYHH